jgi:hypothetical protein
MYLGLMKLQVGFPSTSPLALHLASMHRQPRGVIIPDSSCLQISNFQNLPAKTEGNRLVSLSLWLISSPV